MSQFSNNLLPTFLSVSLMEQMYELAANRHARGLSLYPCYKTLMQKAARTLYKKRTTTVDHLLSHLLTHVVCNVS